MTIPSPRGVIRRQPVRLLAITGLGVLIAALFASAATSGQATTFGVSVQAPVTAGSPFTVTVTALDANGNVDKSYKDNHTLTFSGAQPAPDTTPPSYPQSQPVVFGQGVASVPVTLFNAAATTLTVSEDNTTITGSSSSFTVSAGAPAELIVSQPPVWVAKNASFGASVTVKDDWGNLVPDTPVSVTLNKTPSALNCPSTAGPCTATTGPTNGSPTGVAAFTLSVSHDALGYQLVATAGSATASSGSFNVGDQYGQFNNGSGPSGQDDPGTTLTNTVVNGSNGNNLALAVDGSIPIRLDLCGGLQTQVGSGTVFEAVKTQTGDPQPTWTVTVTVKKAALIDTSRGAASYDMCLGTRNIWVAQGGATGTNDCLPNPSATSFSTSLSWPAKGGCAVPDGPDPATAVYWGNVLDAGKPGTGTPANIKDCSQARAPVIMSKNKTGPGNLVLKLCVPFPWDGFGAGH
jgi:hypothetical protein